MVSKSTLQLWEVGVWDSGRHDKAGHHISVTQSLTLFSKLQASRKAAAREESDGERIGERREAYTAAPERRERWRENRREKGGLLSPRR
ncbi:hypothetical protein L1049_011322 [Liquidambar formosana]|uniref:Uncharacterized protein n=1 Tax=Liquidambar formosana TaxID=63359 RepID=A0AAP0RR41_LIQFO